MMRKTLLNKTTFTLATVLLLAAAFAGSVFGRRQQHTAAPEKPAILLPGMGAIHHPVSTRVGRR
jgi:hypothetical protein